VTIIKAARAGRAALANSMVHSKSSDDIRHNRRQRLGTAAVTIAAFA